LQADSRKARDASRGWRGEQNFAVQNLQDVRERGLHDPTIGEWASTRRFEKEISPAREWWGEDVVFQIANVPSRDRAPSGHATTQGIDLIGAHCSMPEILRRALYNLTGARRLSIFEYRSSKQVGEIASAPFSWALCRRNSTTATSDWAQERCRVVSSVEISPCFSSVSCRPLVCSEASSATYGHLRYQVRAKIKGPCFKHYVV
jgi:hypothetical protein